MEYCQHRYVMRRLSLWAQLLKKYRRNWNSSKPILIALCGTLEYVYYSPWSSTMWEPGLSLLTGGTEAASGEFERVCLTRAIFEAPPGLCMSWLSLILFLTYFSYFYFYQRYHRYFSSESCDVALDISEYWFSDEIDVAAAVAQD